MTGGSSLRFAEPFYLNGLWIGLLFLLGVFVWRRLWLNRQWKSFFTERNWKKLTPDVSNSRRVFRLWFFYLSYVFLILALARPQMGSSLQNTKSLGVELIIAFDVSESMLAEDAKPSRLSFAKSEISRFLDQLGGDRVGLVAFAGSAFLVSPITTDKGAIKMFLDGLSPFSVSSQGTNIGEALRVAAEAFDRGGVDEAENQKSTRVILVASDGEDHEQLALIVASDLFNKGVRIFTWGFGTAQGAPIPERDEFGDLKGYKKDRSGQVVNSTSTDKFLRAVADAGGGKYVHAVFGGQAPETLEKAINQLEKNEIDSSSLVVYDEKFQIPLAIAVLLFLVTLLVAEAKTLRKATS